MATVGTQAGPAGARIVCEKPAYGFGEMDNRKTVEHKFTIKNEGTADLQITKLWSGCRCAFVSIAVSNIPPGNTAEVAAKIVLHGRAGEQKKSFYVHSNDPTQNILRLEMAGVAVPWIEITPERLDFGNIERDASATREALISWRAGLKFSVTNVQTSMKQFLVETNAPPPGKTCRITMKTIPPVPHGITRGNITAFTDDPSCPKVEIPVTVMALTDIVVVPCELQLGKSNEGWPASRYVALRSRTGKPFKIVGIDLPDPGIKHVIMPMGSQGYRIELPPPKLNSDIGGEELKIHTDLPGSDELIVPFKALSGGSKDKMP